MTDPIADLATRIRNAYLTSGSEVEIPHSKIKEALAGMLVKQGFVKDMRVEKTKPQAKLVITLKYLGKIPAVEGIERISTPGRRVYTTSKKTPRTLEGLGSTIISTNQGIMTDKEARKKNLGGEILLKVW